jgi:tetratricopeptide (TPR) repeat protein
MRYLCIQCDEKFELSSQQELRCPKCLRVHGIRELSAAPSALPARSSGRRARIVVAVVAVLGLLAGGGYLSWLHERRPDPATLARSPLGQRVLRRELGASGVEAGTLVRLFELSPEMERFAARAVAGETSAEGRARAVVKALRARASSQAFVPWSLTDPRLGPVMTAAEVLSVISKDGARKELYPLELAALAVAALRAADVPAMLAEVHAWPSERAPLDPSGRFGYFAPALLTANGKAHVFDVYGGRAEQASCSDCVVLSDVQAVGAGLALRATQRLAQNEDPALALRDADAAVKLWPSSAASRSARGAVLLANGASDLGQGELEAAAQMRPDAPRRNNLAMLYLALGDTERAAREVAQALEQQPDFASAHATLAEIHLAQGEREQARAELDKMQAIDPGSPSLPLAFAQFYAATGQNEQAIEHARRAAQARPSDPQVHLLLARIYRQAGRYEAMRTEAREVLSLSPPALTARMRELLERVLGPTALESELEPSAPNAAPANAAKATLPEPDRLDLSQAPGLDRSRLHLLDEPAGAPSDGTLKHTNQAPRLRLNEPGTDPTPRARP